MSAEQDTMRLVAEVVDKFSGPLKDLIARVKESGKANEEAHGKGAKAAREHAKHLKELHEQISKVRETTVNLMSPAFAAVGLSIGGVAEAIKSVVESVRSYGEVGYQLEMVGRKAGMTAEHVRTLEEVGQRLGISAEAMGDGLSKFGEFMDATQRRAPAALNAWNQMPGLWQRLGKSLIGLNRDAQVDKVLDFIPSVRDVDQRKRILDLIGLPEDYAVKTREEIQKARTATAEWERLHPGSLDRAKKTKEAWDNLEATFRGIKDDLGAAFGPDIVKGVDTLDHFLSDKSNIDAFRTALHNAGVEIKKEWGDVEGIFRSIGDILRGVENAKIILNHDVFGSKSLRDELDANPNARPGTFEERWNRLPTPEDKKFTDDLRSGASPFGGTYTPMAFHQGGDGFSAKDPQKMLEASVKDGVLDAFREWAGMQSAGGTGSGFTNASFSPGGGSGGLHSGGGYHVMRNGDADAAGQPPEGSNAYNGVGGIDLTGKNSGKLGPFARERFAKELAANPALRNKIMRIAANEQGSHPLGTQAVLESMMNRAAMRGTSLETQARWHESEGGYYQQGNMGRGALENPRQRAILEKSLKNVLAGSDITGLATDNSSQGLAEREAATGKFIRHTKIHGESFFHPGIAEPAWARRWAQMKAEHDAFIAEHPHGVGASLRDHIRNHGSLLKHAKQSGLFGSESSKHLGHASVSVDFTGMPRGVRTSASATGLFKETRLNRGRAMPMADQDG